MVLGEVRTLNLLGHPVAGTDGRARAVDPVPHPLLPHTDGSASWRAGASTRLSRAYA
ncbi:hypothetical protein [Streptomyces sp. NPDC008122]|uniref:hypothetical protein n=1 Tax=Streptomyces sp. NPDC008122 TaxID=3364810 RepID=UPI0036EEEF5C